MITGCTCTKWRQRLNYMYTQLASPSQRWGEVDLQQPGLQVLIDQDIKPKEFYANQRSQKVHEYIQRNVTDATCTCTKHVIVHVY